MLRESILNMYEYSSNVGQELPEHGTCQLDIELCKTRAPDLTVQLKVGRPLADITAEFSSQQQLAQENNTVQ